MPLPCSMNWPYMYLAIGSPVLLASMVVVTFCALTPSAIVPTAIAARTIFRDQRGFILHLLSAGIFILDTGVPFRIHPATFDPASRTFSSGSGLRPRKAQLSPLGDVASVSGSYRGFIRRPMKRT